MAVITNTFTAEADQTDFEPSFPFLRAGDLIVTVNDLSADFTIPSTGLVRLDAATESGDEVVIRRSTDIEEEIVDWQDASAWLSDDMNRSQLQLLFGLQEVEQRIDSLIESINDEDLVLTPPENNSRFLYSEGDAWVEKTVAQVQTILGIDEPGTSPVPDPQLPANPEVALWLISQDDGGGTPEYNLISTGTAKSVLGISTLQSQVDALNDVPSPINGRVIYGSGGVWSTLVATNSNTGLAQTLGLGNLVNLNTGTAVGRIPLLVSGGSGGVALPAVSGTNLLDVASPGFASFRATYSQKLTSASVNAGGYWEVFDTANPAVLMTENPTSQTFATIDSATGYIKLTGGVYTITAETGLVAGSGGGTIDCQAFCTIWNHSDTLLLGAGPMAHCSNQDVVGMPMGCTAMITVPTGTTKLIKVSPKLYARNGACSIETIYADSTSTTACRVHITKHKSL